MHREKEKHTEEEKKCKVKLVRAYGGCLGAKRRRRAWQAAKSYGEPQAGLDP